jgi:hypothetical protein
MSAFKEKFTKLWERRGLDQAEMGARLGYRAPTFNKRLNGKLKMKRPDILRALDVLSSVNPVSAEDANELLELAGYEGLADEVNADGPLEGRQRGFGFAAPDLSESHSEDRGDQLREILREIAEVTHRIEEIKRVVEELLRSEGRGK